MYTSTMRICIHNRGMYEQYTRIEVLLIRYCFMNLVLHKGGQNESSSWL